MPRSSSPTPTPRRDSLQQQLEYPTRQGSGIGTKAGDEALPEQTCANTGPVPAAPVPPAARPDVVQPEASDPQDHRRSYTPDMTRAELDDMIAEAVRILAGSKKLKPGKIRESRLQEIQMTSLEF